MLTMEWLVSVMAFEKILGGPEQSLCFQSGFV